MKNKKEIKNSKRQKWNQIQLKGEVNKFKKIE
jgi:hypothetical protein